MSPPVVPRLCEDGTIVCLASGPSLTTEDVEYVRGKAVVIAINDAIRLAPWADVLYSSDGSWWLRHGKRLAFNGIKARVNQAKWQPNEKSRQFRSEGGILIFRNTGERGLELERDGLRTYKNSGGSAINLAVHLGAKRILLLGYDMGPHNNRNHFYEKEPHQVRSPYQAFRKLIGTMVDPLNEIGVDVINCSRRTELECFPRVELREALPAMEQAA